MFSPAEPARSAYQPPPSQPVAGYQRSPLTTLFLEKKDPAQGHPLNQYVVAVQINGHPTSLLVDTGGCESLISTAFYRELQIVPIPDVFRFQRGIINGRRVSRMHLRQLAIGGVAYRNVRGVLAEVQTIKIRQGPSAGFSVAGLLGTDFLRDHQAVVDCAHGGLFLQTDPKAKVLTAGLPAQGWTALPMKINGEGYLSVEAGVNGFRGRMLIDTGAGVVMLNQSQARRAKVKLIGRRIKMTGVAISDPRAEIAQVGQLTLSGYRVADDYAVVSGKWEKVMIGSGGPYLGLLGFDFLCENQAVIDYRTKTLYLKRGKAS
jgi:predicted aspartyl protease